MQFLIGVLLFFAGLLVMANSGPSFRNSHLVRLELSNGAKYSMWTNMPVTPAAGQEIVFASHAFVTDSARIRMRGDGHVWTGIDCREIGRWGSEASDEICEAELVKLGFKQDKPPQPQATEPQPDMQFERIELPDGSVVL
jgi:hypothetical protein